MYWFKHGSDVCIGSNMGEMYVLVQTWESCMYWFKHDMALTLYQLSEGTFFDPAAKVSLCWQMADITYT